MTIPLAGISEASAAPASMAPLEPPLDEEKPPSCALLGSPNADYASDEPHATIAATPHSAVAKIPA